VDVSELIARESIRGTLSRYTFSGDRGLLDQLAECFTEDGVLELVDGWTARGREEILARTTAAVPMRDGVRRAPILRHHLTSQRIELTGPADARAWTYFLAATEVGPDHGGRYVDRLRRVGEHWLISHRRVVVEWYSPQTVYPEHALRRDRGR
jgi:hypothetical protein